MSSPKYSWKDDENIGEHSTIEGLMLLTSVSSPVASANMQPTQRSVRLPTPQAGLGEFLLPGGVESTGYAQGCSQQSAWSKVASDTHQIGDYMS